MRYGIFRYMGVSAISGNDLFDKMFLWFKRVPAKVQLLHSCVGLMTVHKFMPVQFVCSVILYTLESWGKPLSEVAPSVFT